MHKNSAASNHGLTSTSHHIWPNPMHKKSAAFQPWSALWIPRAQQVRPWVYPGTPTPTHAHNNQHRDRYVYDILPYGWSKKKGFGPKNIGLGPKKRGLVQKKGLWSKKYFDGPNTCWDDIHISLLLFTLRYFGPENISTLRFFFLKVVFYFQISFSKIYFHKF